VQVETLNERFRNNLMATESSAGYFFLSSSARNYLPKYQYAGEDRSLLYIHILSPLAAVLVNHCTPSSVAPNTITITGLMFMIASYAIMCYYYPVLQPLSEEPSWIFAFHGCAMLIYQTLDNMDGKQARKTGSSSPLGLLFDHGCDAVNTIIGSIGWIIGLGLTPQHDLIECAALIFGPFMVFYIATWEEFYTGKLVLPIINGPSEGVAGGAILSFVTCILGTSFWQSTSIFDQFLSPWIPEFIPPLRNADLQVLCAVIGILNESIDKSHKVAKKYGLKTLVTQLPLWGLIIASSFADTSMWLRMPRITLHIFSGLFVESVTQMMLDHISNQTFCVRRRWVLAPLLLLALIPRGMIGPKTDTILLIYCTTLWTFLLFKFCMVVHEICCLLNIFCFEIKNNMENKRRKIA